MSIKKLSYDEFVASYEKYGKTVNQINPSKKSLNSNQLGTLYKKYIRSYEKKVNKVIKATTPKKKAKVDIGWQILRDSVFKRDNNSCQLWPYVTDLFLREDILSNEIYQILDPCHVFGKGAYPYLKYDIDNIVVLCRLFHNRLDAYRDPFTNVSIGKEGTYDVWRSIIGNERYNSLLDKINKRRNL